MRISGNEMMQGIGNIQSIGNANQPPFNNGQIVSNDSSDVTISETGKRMGNMMDRAGKMPPPPREKVAEMKSSIEELNLSELDLENMTEEEISEVASEINDVMESFKPEHITNGIDVSTMSAEEQKTFVSEFKNNADSVLQSIGQMEGMMEGRPPMGGKGSAGGNPPMGGARKAISAYEGTESTQPTEEEEQLDMLESLLEALEADEESDDSSSSEFYSLIGSYLNS